MSVLSIKLPLLARPFWVLRFPFLFPFNELLSLSLSNSNDEVSTQMSYFKVSKWRHDIHHNDTKHNDTKQTTISILTISIEGLFVTLSIKTLSIMALSIKGLFPTLSIKTLSILTISIEGLFVTLE